MKSLNKLSRYLLLGVVFVSWGTPLSSEARSIFYSTQKRASSASKNISKNKTHKKKSLKKSLKKLLVKKPEKKIPTQKVLPKKVLTLKQRSWGMRAGSGIDAYDSWSLIKRPSFKKKYCHSKSSPVVAIIDTGVDFSHPDLKESRWENLKEINGKPGIDDDQNGYVDDKYGWDFATNTPIIMDVHGHGTHIAGIVAAKSSKKEGFMGACPGVRIMSLRYFVDFSSWKKNLMNTIRAFKYAVNNGARIINYSGGGPEHSKSEEEVLKAAHMKGILVIAAAGNETSDSDKRPFFPAAYALPNIISVSAVKENGEMLPASNWGLKNVDIAAPGHSIVSTQRRGAYGFLAGTSQATAFVTGIAALLWVEKPSLSALRVKELIERSGLKRKNMFKKNATSSIASAERAVRLLHRDMARDQLRRKRLKKLKSHAKKRMLTESMNRKK